MGNLTEELESGGVNNCSMLKHNKNQNYVRNLFIPKFSKKDFVIYHQNVRGLNSNKIEELSVSLSANLLHIICFTEHNFGGNETDTIAQANSSLGAKFSSNSFKNGGISTVFLLTNLFSPLI